MFPQSETMYNRFRNTSPEFYTKSKENSHNDLNFVYQSPRNRNFEVKRQHTMIMMKKILSQTKAIFESGERRNAILMTRNDQADKFQLPKYDRTYGLI